MRKFERCPPENLFNYDELTLTDDPASKTVID